MQCVSDSDILNNKLNIDYVVPQRKVLAPIIFSIYINNLFNVDSKGEIIGYADDTAIFYKAVIWDELHKKLTEDIAFIKNCFDQKLLNRCELGWLLL